MKRIYFNNCLTSKPAPEVVKLTTEYMNNRFYFPENFNAMGTTTSEDLDNAKRVIANSMGANSKEIHFTSGGTAANNLAIKGYLTANSNKGTHII